MKPGDTVQWRLSKSRACQSFERVGEIVSIIDTIQLAYIKPRRGRNVYVFVSDLTLVQTEARK